MLCRHLTGVVAGVTRTRVQRWIEDGQVAVNGRPAVRVAARAALGDRISVALPAGEVADRSRPAAEHLPLDILYDDDWLLAVNKPAGMVTHPAYKHPHGTLMNALLWHARDWPAPQRPSLIGRLDKLTSGLVIVAKTAAFHAALQRELGSHRSEKDYLAVVYGRVTPVRGTIDLRLARDRDDRRRVVASVMMGAASQTQYERLTFAAAAPVGLSLVRCRLMTGRMHQIRVHLAARGWPLVGDPTYGTPRWSEIADADLGNVLRSFPRQALHAWRIAFTHPATGRRLRIEAALPQDLAEMLRFTGFTGFYGF